MTSCDLWGDSRMIADAVIVVYGYLEVSGTPHTLQTRSGTPAAPPLTRRATPNLVPLLHSDNYSSLPRRVPVP